MSDVRSRPDPQQDLEARFEILMQSPLRGAILRHLAAKPAETFSVAGLAQVMGRMRLDVENCATDLVAFGVVSEAGPPGSREYKFHKPGDPALRAEVDAFLRRPPAPSDEDRSPAVQRFRDLIATDEKMVVALEWIRTAAKSDIAVLILGPTGSGKELVARMIHELSARRSHRLQTVNCAALPENLFESELFGYERGAFTGAQERKLGRFELADRGTLFLDEVGDLTLLAQAKLLRALEERRIERLGGNEPIDVDFRLVTATNRPLDALVRDGRFREDLYYRVNAFSVRLPSLRERAEDIPILAERFLARYCAANGLRSDGKVLARNTVELLSNYHWPGNIRELESTISRAALSSPGRVIRPGDIELLHPGSVAGSGSGDLLTLAQAERAHIAHVLEAVRWNKKLAARVLEISRGTLYRKIVEYGLEEGPA